MVNLIQGDCLEVMDKLIADGIKVDAIICDPPYGTTACKWDSVIPFDEMWLRLNKLIKPNGAIVLFGSEPFSSALRMSNIKNYKYDWVWDKVLSVGHLVSKYRPLQRTETISVFSHGACSFTKSGNKMSYTPVMEKRDKKRRHVVSISKSELVNNHTMNKDYKRADYEYRFPTNVLNFSNANRKGKKHPTQKPVALMEYLIKTYTNENELVLDFTCGSGTTGVACKNLNRNFIGIEFVRTYLNIANRRIRGISLHNKIKTKESK